MKVKLLQGVALLQNSTLVFPCRHLSASFGCSGTQKKKQIAEIIRPTKVRNTFQYAELSLVQLRSWLTLWTS